jgi:exonuclease SbcD
MGIKILATADLHLGMKFAAYPEVQAELAEARYETLRRLVETANREQCNLFLVAGDLFHRATAPKKEVLRAANLLAEFQGECAAVLPGNHDYYAGSSGSLWGSFRENAGDRVLLLDQRRVYDLAHYGLEAAIYPGPCDAKHSRENALGWLPLPEPPPEPPGEILRIGVAHGSVEGMSPDAQGAYFPMTRAELRRAGMDLWVVGHTHGQYPRVEDEEDNLFIPGCPEPDGFDCSHEGRAWILTAGAGKGVRRRSLSTGAYRFQRREIRLDNGSDLETLFAAYSPESCARTLIRLELAGCLQAAKLQQLRETVAGLASSLFWLRVDDAALEEEISRERLEREFSAGSFPYLLLMRLIEAEDREALQIAYGLIREARS